MQFDQGFDDSRSKSMSLLFISTNRHIELWSTNIFKLWTELTYDFKIFFELFLFDHLGTAAFVSFPEKILSSDEISRFKIISAFNIFFSGFLRQKLHASFVIDDSFLYLVSVKLFLLASDDQRCILNSPNFRHFIMLPFEIRWDESDRVIDQIWIFHRILTKWFFIVEKFFGLFCV
jgi:hypothetical protein